MIIILLLRIKYNLNDTILLQMIASLLLRTWRTFFNIYLLNYSTCDFFRNIYQKAFIYYVILFRETYSSLKKYWCRNSAKKRLQKENRFLLRTFYTRYSESLKFRTEFSRRFIFKEDVQVLYFQCEPSTLCLY